LAIRVKS